MICKNCTEEVVQNRVRNSPEPFTFHPWKHADTHLIGCFHEGNPTGYKAWPKEGK